MLDDVILINLPITLSGMWQDLSNVSDQMADNLVTSVPSSHDQYSGDIHQLVAKYCGSCRLFSV